MIKKATLSQAALGKWHIDDSKKKDGAKIVRPCKTLSKAENSRALHGKNYKKLIDLTRGKGGTEVNATVFL